LHRDLTPSPPEGFKLQTPMPAILRVMKKFEMYVISCQNNMKFSHAIAEVCISSTKNGTVTCIWSLTPQLEILMSESRHL
jgi:hypothetical protein